MKKRFLTGLLAGLLLLIVGAAVLAEEEALPAEIQTYFAGDAFKGAEIKGTAHYAGSGSDGQWFVLVRSAKGTNTLYAFRLSGGVWKHGFHTSAAVPQGKNTVEIDTVDSMDTWSNDKHYGGPLLIIVQYDEFGENIVLFTAYQRNGSGQWNLVHIWSHTGFENMDIGKDRITYYKELGSGQVAGTVKGTIQRDLRYVSLSAVPKTLKKARSSLTSAPDLPAGSELQAQEIQFTGGKKYAVHSAPDKQSIRGGNGKASVSTNGWIQVFGRENGWILIQYSIDSSHYRFGYIDAASLPKKANVPELNFTRTPVLTAYSVSVTDDPLYSQSPLMVLPEGAEVTWLATMGSWAYIEGSGCRGFMPVSAIAMPASVSRETFSVYTASDGLQYPLFEVRKLLFDASGKVYAVSGAYERTVEDEEGAHGVMADGGASFTYPLAPDFRAEMLGSMTDPDMANLPVTDLYAWYVSAYMDGQAPAGGHLTFLYDLPEAEREFAEADFWFVTTRIRLNSQGQIEYMESVYVPWG